MSTIAQHKNKIQNNKDFYDTFVINGSTNFPGWAIVVMFYIAVHWVELYFSKCHNTHNANHSERNRSLVNDSNLSVIYSDYKRLYDWSRAARYEAAVFSSAYVVKAMTRLNNIENHIATLI